MYEQVVKGALWRYLVNKHVESISFLIKYLQRQFKNCIVPIHVDFLAAFFPVFSGALLLLLARLCYLYSGGTSGILVCVHVSKTERGLTPSSITSAEKLHWEA